MTVHEAAARTNRSAELIRRWIRDDRLPAVKVGRDWLIADDDLALIDAMPKRKRGKRE